MPNTDPIFSSSPSNASSRSGGKIRRTPLVISAVVLILGLAFLSFFLSAHPQNDDTTVRNATIARVEEKTIRDIVAVSGVLELSRKEIITAPGAGVVEQVAVDEGSLVKAGDVLLRIETDDLETELESQKLALEKLLRETEQSAAAYGYNQRTYRLQIESAKREVSETERSLARVRALREKNLASENELLTAEKAVLTAQDAQEKAEIQLEQADTLYTLTVKNAATDRTILETEIADLEDTIEAFTVRTARGGTVYSLNVESGGTVAAYAELAVVAEPADSRAALDVPETRISSVSKGMAVTVYVGDAAYPATVETVAPSATSSSSSSGSVVRVTANFAEKPERPTIGGTISGEIVAGTIPDALTLPRGAFLSSGNYTSAYVVSGGVAEKRTVKFGIADGSSIQILSGLKEGDQVIVSDYRDFIHLDTFPVNPGK